MELRPLLKELGRSQPNVVQKRLQDVAAMVSHLLEKWERGAWTCSFTGQSWSSAHLLDDVRVYGVQTVWLKNSSRCRTPTRQCQNTTTLTAVTTVALELLDPLCHGQQLRAAMATARVRLYRSRPGQAWLSRQRAEREDLKLASGAATRARHDTKRRADDTASRRSVHQF